jgi:hypothetical protein
MVCDCRHSAFHHAGLEGYCMVEGCECDVYDEEVEDAVDWDESAEYDWDMEHNAEEE